MKNVLNLIEVLETLPVAVCEMILGILNLEIQAEKSPKKVEKISNTIFLVEKAIRLKTAQITLIGNL